MYVSNCCFFGLMLLVMSAAVASRFVQFVFLAGDITAALCVQLASFC